jgi:hypothetical protein
VSALSLSLSLSLHAIPKSELADYHGDGRTRLARFLLFDRDAALSLTDKLRCLGPLLFAVQNHFFGAGFKLFAGEYKISGAGLTVWDSKMVLYFLLYRTSSRGGLIRFAVQNWIFGPRLIGRDSQSRDGDCHVGVERRCVQPLGELGMR